MDQIGLNPFRGKRLKNPVYNGKTGINGDRFKGLML